MLVRAAVIVLLPVSLMMADCDSNNDCVPVGTNLFENQSEVAEHAKSMDLSTKPHEIAFIVGSAHAYSQIEGGQSGVPVVICLRRGKVMDTEYRVLSTSGKPLSDWQSTSQMRRP